MRHGHGHGSALVDGINRTALLQINGKLVRQRTAAARRDGGGSEARVEGQAFTQGPFGAASRQNIQVHLSIHLHNDCTVLKVVTTET